jgi:hypothetical protein
LLSYTNKALNLNNFNVNNLNNLNNSNNINNNVLQNTVNANPEKTKILGFGGIRKDRVFINEKNRVLIHSDVNGAFNIIRKVFIDFKYEKSINTTHHIVTIASNKKKFQYIT